MVASLSPPRAPTAPQLRAWRGFLRAHDAVTRVLEAELEREHDLPLASYDVLVQLSEAGPAGLRMSDLAGARLVDRLEREGLVQRRSCPSDARGTLAALTAAGRARLDGASPAHMRGVSEHFAARFDDAEIAMLTTLLERLAGPERANVGGCGG